MLRSVLIRLNAPIHVESYVYFVVDVLLKTLNANRWCRQYELLSQLNEHFHVTSDLRFEDVDFNLFRVSSHIIKTLHGTACLLNSKGTVLETKDAVN
jgi:hypothetical protein